MSDWHCTVHGIRNCTICLQRITWTKGIATCSCEQHRPSVHTRRRILPTTTTRTA